MYLGRHDVCDLIETHIHLPSDIVNITPLCVNVQSAFAQTRDWGRSDMLARNVLRAGPC
jgi:hypothetical protein